MAKKGKSMWRGVKNEDETARRKQHGRGWDNKGCGDRMKEDERPATRDERETDRDGRGRGGEKGPSGEVTRKGKKRTVGGG